MNTKLTFFTKTALTLLFLISFSFLSGPALADDDCHDPIASWQPREVLKQRLEQQGWLVQRIRIDDNCYEVRAVDEQGRKVKATYAPASLTLIKLKVKHAGHDHPNRKHRSEASSIDKDNNS